MTSKRIYGFEDRYKRTTRNKDVIKLKHLKDFKEPEAYKLFNNAVLHFEVKNNIKLNDRLYLKLMKKFKDNKELIEYAINDENKQYRVPRLICKTFKNGSLNMKIDNFELEFSKQKRIIRNASVAKVLASSRFNVLPIDMPEINDVDKLRVLIAAISNNGIIHGRDRNFYFTDRDFLNYIYKFYFDEKFNRLYKLWIKNNKMKILKPSLDHIKPVALGGTNDLDNLQFITFFENTAKMDTPPEVWNKIKDNIHLFF